MQCQQAAQYRFGEFVLDTESGELRHNGSTVRLQPQPLELLLALLQHPGQIVTREQLQTSLWPQDTYVEFGDALNHAVRRLRSVLGDTAQVPRYIETIPRRGYRLTVPVECDAPVSAQGLAPASCATVRSRGWHWLIAGAALCVAAIVATVFLVRSHRAAGRITSLAVLPFTNLSGTPEQEYFADGLTDTLTAELSQISALRVVSRTSAMHYKGSKKTVPEIASELGADGIVEGSVVRDGSRVRVTVQLIHAGSDTHIWARRYDRDQRDVISLQSDVALAIANEVRTQLKPGEKIRLLHAAAVNPEAFDWYMQGRYWWSKRDHEGIKKALDCFQRAIEADPNYALAYSGLADALRMTTAFEVLPGAADIRERQAAAAQTAVRLDSDSAEAHTSLAAVYQRDMQWAQAETEFRRALEINPNYAVAHHWYASYLILHGRLDEALQQATTAQRLDPLYLPAAMSLANILRQEGRLTEADAQMDRALRIDPVFLMGHCFRRSIREDQGRFAEAIDEGERCGLPESRERDHIRADALRAALARGGAPGYWEQKLEFGLADFKNKKGGESDIILAYAHLGDKERALDWLNHGSCRKMIAAGLFEPVMQPLRSDPRFQSFLSCLHLQQ